MSETLSLPSYDRAETPAAGPRDPVLCQRAAAETPRVDRVRRDLGRHVALIPWRAEAPVGGTACAHVSLDGILIRSSRGIFTI